MSFPTLTLCCLSMVPPLFVSESGVILPWHLRHTVALDVAHAILHLHTGLPELTAHGNVASASVTLLRDSATAKVRRSRRRRRSAHTASVCGGRNAQPLCMGGATHSLCVGGPTERPAPSPVCARARRRCRRQPGVVICPQSAQCLSLLPPASTCAARRLQHDSCRIGQDPPRVRPMPQHPAHPRLPCFFFSSLSWGHSAPMMGWVLWHRNKSSAANNPCSPHCPPVLGRCPGVALLDHYTWLVRLRLEGRSEGQCIIVMQ